LLDWRNIKGYTRDTLFRDFQDRDPFSQQEFIARGCQKYGLRETTCQQKFWRGLREGFLKKVKTGQYSFVPGWRRLKNYHRGTLIKDFSHCLFFSWQDFWKIGKLKYGLKKSTCRQKLWWAERKSLIERKNGFYRLV
jgi:hypothetical protein